MPRWFRSIATCACFVAFSLGTGVISRVLIPLAKLRGRDPRQMLFRCYRAFLWVMTAAGVGRFDHATLPADLPDEGAFVVVANHPTLVDVLFILGTIPGVCCVVHRRLFRSFFIGPTLRYGRHIRGPDPQEPEASVLDAIVERLNEGTPVLIFPEGTRSPPWSLQRFKRGAVEAAIRAEVPLVPLFLQCDPPTLMKGQTWWQVPERRWHLTIDFLPLMDPAHDGEDSQSITRELKDRYTALVADAKAAALGPR